MDLDILLHFYEPSGKKSIFFQSLLYADYRYCGRVIFIYSVLVTGLLFLSRHYDQY